MQNPSLADGLGRPLQDLRLSVTDRCNFRCRYCMPRERFDRRHAFVPREEILSFEEIERLVRQFVTLGVRKVRITGGEPLLRHDLPRLVAALAAIDGLEELTLTTNGSLLASQGRSLADAGLDRVTVSLDAIEDAALRAITDVDYSAGHVLAGIEAAAEVGLGPVKVNTVVRRGMNDGQVLPMARHFRHSGHILRFIEFMDAGNINGWRMDEVVPGSELVETLASRWPLEALPPDRPSEVATRYRYRDGGGEVGIITSVTAPFCRTCTRARITATGALFTCLFASEGQDLRPWLRSGAPDAGIRDFLEACWQGRTDRYSEQRTRGEDIFRPKVEMSRIGG